MDQEQPLVIEEGEQYEGNVLSELDQSDDEDLFNLYCPTCLLSFSDNAAYKEHYKSELHQYNVKRKMVGLPPSRPEQFEALKASIPNL